MALETLQHLIDGVSRDSETRKTLPVPSPLSGAADREIARGGPVEANLSVKSARTAGEAWRKVPGHVRAEILRKISHALEEKREEMARRIAQEIGKPLTEARREVERAASVFSLSADALRHLVGETYPADAYPLPEGNEERMLFTLREPLGVVVAISPFNFPLNLLSHKVAPALAVGNTVVAKPASPGSGTALRLAQLALECGLPPGVFNVVLGSGPEVGMSLVSHPGVRLVTFTGSVDVGRKVAERAGAGGKRVLLELGGMDALLVFDDAQLSEAVDAAVRGGFAFSGQVCTATKRVLVAEKLAPEFLRALTVRAEKLRIGSPLEESTEIGPLIDLPSLERVEAMVGEALEKGAHLVTGGRRVAEAPGPLYYAPTVLSDVPADARVVQEEPFGPVLPVQTFSEESEAIELANSTRYGLQASIFTRDLGQALRVVRALSVGSVHVNDPTTLRWDALPFGGVRASGLGREGVDRALREMTEEKLVSVRLGPRDRPPGTDFAGSAPATGNR